MLCPEYWIIATLFPNHVPSILVKLWRITICLHSKSKCSDPPILPIFRTLIYINGCELPLHWCVNIHLIMTSFNQGIMYIDMRVSHRNLPKLQSRFRRLFVSIIDSWMQVLRDMSGHSSVSAVSRHGIIVFYARVVQVALGESPAKSKLWMFRHMRCGGRHYRLGSLLFWYMKEMVELAASPVRYIRPPFHMDININIYTWEDYKYMLHYTESDVVGLEIGQFWDPRTSYPG